MRFVRDYRLALFICVLAAMDFDGKYNKYIDRFIPKYVVYVVQKVNFKLLLPARDSDVKI